MEWKKITGRENDYEVSRCGLIRKVGGKVIGQWENDQGYMLARLANPRKTVRVHRVVATAFCDNPRKLNAVNHIDFNRSNNSADNLEWCTQWENLSHSSKAGRMQRDYWTGKRSPSASLSDEAVSMIRKEYALGGISWQSLADKYNTNKRTVGRIVNGESYV